MTGYWGALVALTLSTYPYVYLLAAPGSERRRVGGGGGAKPRRGTPARVLASDAAGAAPVARRRVAPRRALRPLRLRRRLAHGLLDPDDRDLRALRVAAALESAAILALVLVALALAIVLVASRWRLRGAIYRSTPGSRTARPVQLGPGDGRRSPSARPSSASSSSFRSACSSGGRSRADPITGRAGVAWSAALELGLRWRRRLPSSRRSSSSRPRCSHGATRRTPPAGSSG